MGNNLCGEEHCSNHVTLGSHACIDMIKEEDESANDGGYSQEWTTSYKVYESSCTLYLKKYANDCDDVNEVFLKLEDDICFGGGIRVWVRRSVHANSFDLHYKYDQKFDDVMSFKSNETFDRRGCVITRIFCYGKGGKRGLIVVEGKKKSREDKHLYALTVVHYYAVSHENICNQNKIDVGLSMIVHIHVINESLNYTVKGPDRHLSSALFQMFEQVYRSGRWNLASCPHCAGEPQGRQSIEVKQNDEDILRTNLESFPTYKQLCKSTSFEQDRTTNMVNSTNYQSQPYDFYQRSRSSPESRLNIRNLNFPASAPHHGPRENKILELIDNKDINGNGNGNRIEGDQKFILSIPLYFGKRKILQYTYREPKHETSEL